MITICFFGSSKDEFFINSTSIIKGIIDYVTSFVDELRIISGGYHGIMKTCSQIAKEKALAESKSIEVYGILYSGYNEPYNKYLDRIIMTDNLGERVQTMIELSNIIIALPGTEGTLHEIHQTIEEIKWNKNVMDISWDMLLIHEFWKYKINIGERENQSNLTFYNDKNIYQLISNLLKRETLNGANCYKFDEDFKQQEVIGKINNIIVGTKFKADIVHEEINNVIALDFAFSIISKEINLGLNKSIAIPEYKNVLYGFLEHNISLSYSNENAKFYQVLDCKQQKSLTELQVNESELVLSKEKKPINQKESFKNWNDHLIKHQLGKVSFWLNKNINLEKHEFYLNLSLFLILDVILPKSKIDLIFAKLEHYLLTTGLDLTLEKFINEFNSITVQKDALHKFKQEVLSHKHTIYNLDPIKLLTAAKIQFRNKNYDKAQIFIDKCSKVFDLLDVTLKSGLYEHRNHPLHGKTVIEIIKFLFEKHISSDIMPILNIDIDNDYTSFGKLKDEDLSNAFTVLFNLWKNAEKSRSYDFSAKEFWIDVNKIDKNLIITFKNKGEIQKKFIEFLIGPHDLPPIRQNSGLDIVKQKMHELNWKFKVVEANNGYTTIVIEIKT